MTKPTERPVLIMVTAGGRNDAERLGEGLVEGRLASVLFGDPRLSIPSITRTASSSESTSRSCS